MSEHYTITNWEDYSRLADGVREYEFWRNGRSGYPVSDVPESLRWVDNRIRSAVEHWEFTNSKPARYFAYVRLNGDGYNMLTCQAEITTWTGQHLGRAFLGRPYRDNFGGTRQSVELKAINGAKYHGTYYRSAGDYCRLKLSTERKAYQRQTVDCWRFYVNYGHGWEHEITEYTRDAMEVNRKAYRENCPYPLRIVKGRERMETDGGTR